MGTIDAKVPNTLDGLAKVNELVSIFVAQENLPAEVTFDLNVVLDEMLSNVIKYGHADGGHHEIALRLSVIGDVLEIEMEDDGKPFDPLSISPPDLKRKFSEREPGGLGVHFVRNLMHEVKYARVADRNRLTLRKYLNL